MSNSRSSRKESRIPINTR